MAFQTMPYLFQQWGDVLAIFAGIFWFGLLFFAGITSSLAMGTPWIGFMRDEFGWKNKKGAWSFGLIALIMGLPTVIFFKEGVFDEYDYWAGTVSLVVFAFLETVLFAWIFGIKRGWEEINLGADIKVPKIFKYIILVVTPGLLGWVLIASIPDMANKATDSDTNNKEWFADAYYAENYGSSAEFGVVDSVTPNFVKISFENERKVFNKAQSSLSTVKYTDYKTYSFKDNQHTVVNKGDLIKPNDKIAEGKFTNNVMYKTLGRLLLITLFIFICVVGYRAYLKRVKEGRATA